MIYNEAVGVSPLHSHIQLKLEVSANVGRS